MITFQLILASLQQRTQANVNVDILPHYQNQTSINTALKIKYIFVAKLPAFRLKCSSMAPVEWVFDDLALKVIISIHTYQ